MNLIKQLSSDIYIYIYIKKLRLVLKRAFLLSFFILFVPFISFGQNLFSGGNGSATNPYKISKADDLLELSYLVNEGYIQTNGYFFEMTNDIDMNTVSEGLFTCLVIVTSPDKYAKQFYWLSNENGWQIMPEKKGDGSYACNSGGKKHLIYLYDTVDGIPQKKTISITEGQGQINLPSNQYLITKDTIIIKDGDTFNVEYEYRRDFVGHMLPIGTPQHFFSGTFNGNDYTIKNLNISSFHHHVGLFGSVVKGTVKNLKIDNAHIIPDYRCYVGVVAGSIRDGATIERCYVTNSLVTTKGSVSVDSNGHEVFHYNGNNYNNGLTYVGGIVGIAYDDDYNKNTKVTKCCVEKTNLWGVNCVGGIIGKNNKPSKDNAEGAASVSDCYELNNSGSVGVNVTYYDTIPNYFGPIFGKSAPYGEWTQDNYFYDNTDYSSSAIGGPNGVEISEDSIKGKIKEIFEGKVRDYYATTGDITNFVDKSSIAGKDIIVKGQGFIAKNLQDYPQPSNITVDVLKGGSLIYEGDAQNVKVDYPMIVSKWNLWGAGSGIFDMLNSNLGTSEGVNAANDIAISPWNDTTNMWSENYPLSSDNVTAGVGYFVWPFDTIRTDGQTSSTTTGTTVEQANGTTIVKGLPVAIQDVVTVNTKINSESQVTGGANKAKWAALANPFSGNMQAQEIFKDNSGTIQGYTIYIYNTEKNVWENAWWDGAGVEEIKPSQGFMVAHAGTTTSKSMANKSFTEKQFILKRPTSYVPNEIQQKSKTSTSNRKYITFTAKTDKTQKNAYAIRSEQAKNGFDINDAYVLLSTSNTNIVEPYFLVENREILKNEFKKIPYECPINFHANESKSVDLSVKNIPDDIDVHLIDVITWQVTVLDTNTVYSFVADKGDNANRFKVRFVKKGDVGITETEQQTAEINIVNNNREVTVFANNLQKVEVINIYGQVVLSKKVSGNKAQLNIEGDSGIYIVKVKTKKGGKVEKIAVK